MLMVVFRLVRKNLNFKIIKSYTKFLFFLDIHKKLNNPYFTWSFFFPNKSKIIQLRVLFTGGKWFNILPKNNSTS